MKFSLLALTMIGSISGLGVIIAIAPGAYANPKPIPAIADQKSQSANLVTEAATLTNQWNTVIDNTNNPNASLRVTDPECKKINPLEYIKNPETFFQPCLATTGSNLQSHEPIEYLKVPRLDSGLSVTVTNF
ncbi:hypothetical protein [Anabaena azotica]|uniref:hypothetical protein n=1 Tax=Anabaena azotica TaxID=197653 RepID=UPI0039A63FBF